MNARLPPELTVGFEEIDAQHRLLLQDVEAAREALGHGLDALKAALAKLGDSYVSHFASEEALMAESAYPDRAKHKGAHDLFMQDFAQLGREVETFGLTPLAQHWVSKRLADWTHFHIQVNDAPLARHLVSRRARSQPGTARPKPISS
jgi:hemerythrin